MKKLFLLLLMSIIAVNGGFAPSTLILTGEDSFEEIQCLSPYNWINCFNYYNYSQIDSYCAIGLRSYVAPIGVMLDFGTTYVVCDPQQLFRLYHSYEWIRAYDIEDGCYLLDIDLQPVRVVRARLINRECYFYRFTVPFVGYHNFFVTDLMINVCDY